MKQSSDSFDRKSLKSLWIGWMLSSGALTLVAVLSMWITRVWLPAVAFTLGVCLYVMVRRNRMVTAPMCYVVPFVTIYALAISGIIMTVIDILNTPRLLPPPPIESRSGVVPYLGALVVYPVATIAFTYSYIKRYSLGYCRDCRRRFGDPAERGLIGALFSQEGLFQRKAMAWFCAGLSVTGWLYYAKEYVNINFTQADIYIFFVLPAMVFVLAAVFMAIRTMSIYYYYARDIGGGLPNYNDTTTMRYIVICDNEILLNFPDEKSISTIGEEKIDTPAKLQISYRKKVLESDARAWFLNMVQRPKGHGIDVRFMYESRSANNLSNTFHYLVFVDSKKRLNSTPGNKWVTIYELNRMTKAHRCNMMLSAEIYRLYTVAMAWKTYDRDGRRLYKIKHYTPTFRVCDIHKWNVDYNDAHWLYVSQNNEDKPFFRMRRFWRRYVSGIND